MTQRFPIAAYALTLPRHERDKFAAMPLLKRDPARAIMSFERMRQRAAT